MNCILGSCLPFPLLTYTLLPAEWRSKIWRTTQDQAIPFEITFSDFTCKLYRPSVYYRQNGVAKSEVSLSTKRSRSRSQFPILTYVLASRSQPRPSHSYQQNGVAKSEKLLSTKQSRSGSRFPSSLVLASRSRSRPSHYYQQNGVAKSEVLLCNKQSRLWSGFSISLVNCTDLHTITGRMA